MNNNFKSIPFVFIVGFVALLLLFPGCAGKSEPIPNLPQTEAIPEQNPLPDAEKQWGEISAGTGDAAYGLLGNLKIPIVPRPGEAAQLSWSIKALEDWTELHAWVQLQYDSGKPGDVRYLPMSEVRKAMLLDGQMDWQGSLSENEVKSFTTTLKFPREGKWSAFIMFLGKSIIGRDLTRTSDRDRYQAPPSIGPYLELYVDENSPQFGFPKDYSRGNTGILIPNYVQPFTGFVEMNKPPGLNEPALLTWGLGSIRDAYNTSLHLSFYYFEGRFQREIPAEDVIVSGPVSITKDAFIEDSAFVDFLTDEKDIGSMWRMESGSLLEIPVSRGWAMKAQSFRERLIETTPYKFATMVTFPKEGIWEVRSYATGYDRDGKKFLAGGGYLYFTVSKSGGTWGWRIPRK